MKGSEIRKRYILLHSESLDRVIVALDSGLSKIGCKRKFRNRSYAIYLTDQYNKDRAINIINTSQGARTIITSGTIKKCKEAMKNGIREDSR